MKLTYSLIFTGLVQFLAPSIVNHVTEQWQDVGRGLIAMCAFLIVHIAGNSNPDGTPSFEAYGPKIAPVTFPSTGQVENPNQQPR